MGRTRTGPSLDNEPCGTCSKTTGGDFVCCDKCNTWHHFICVGVDKNIETQPWMCKTCASGIPSTTASFKPKQPETTLKSSPVLEASEKKKLIRQLDQQKEQVKQTKIAHDALAKKLEEQQTTNNAAQEALSKRLEEQMSANAAAQAEMKKLFEEQKKTLEEQNRHFNTEKVAWTKALTQSEQLAQLEIARLNARLALSSNAPPSTTISPMITPATTGEPTATTSTVTATVTAFTNTSTTNTTPSNYGGTSSWSPLISSIWSQPSTSVVTSSSGFHMPPPTSSASPPFVFTPPTFQTSIPMSGTEQSVVTPQAVPEAQLGDLMRRGYLAKLPEFSGRVKEWPVFESIYISTTHRGNYSEAENVDRLRTALKKPASDLVNHLLMTAVSATAIMDQLKKAYGQFHMIQDVLIEEMLAFPTLKSMADPKLRELSSMLNNYNTTMNVMGKPTYIVNNVIVRKLVTKLPLIYHREWITFRTPENEDSLATLGEFLLQKVDEIPAELFNRSAAKTEVSSAPVSKRVNAHSQAANTEASASNNEKRQLTCFSCKRPGHGLLDCRLFDKLSVREKNKIVSDNKVCYVCLKGKHYGRDCPESKRCTHNGCIKFHHPKLHVDQTERANRQFIPRSNNEAASSNAQASASTSEESKEPTKPVLTHKSDNSVLFKILPIRVYRSDGTFIETHAFLDDGSSLTLMEKDLLDQLNISSTPEHLKLQWTNGIVRDEEAFKANIVVSSKKCRTKHRLVEVFAIPNLDLPTQSLNAADLKSRYNHLKGLPFEDLVNAKPQILIGLLNASFLRGEKDHIQGDNDPIATKTKLGWVVYGNARPTRSVRSLNNKASGMQLSIREVMKSDEELHELVKFNFSTEAFGVMPPVKDLIGTETQRALDVMKRTLNFVDGRYEIGLLWRSDQVNLPDSYPMALKRLESQERTLIKNPDLLEWKNKHVRELLAKGYARVATPDDLSHPWPRIWFCPTFIVVNQNKVPPKPRDVADVAAKVNNQSLNTHLLKGPDNLAPLIGGLSKFRERKICVNADVKEMFHQIRIVKEDQQCQRFLWRDADQSRTPTVYVMQCMMFGPTCSPTCAQYVKNLHASKYAEECPEAVDGLINRTYVDDYFNSHPDVASALKCSLDAIKICEDMGFDLTGFQSNSQELLKQLSSGKVKSSLVSLDQNQEPSITKILGMFWDPSSDTFTYKMFKDELLMKMLNTDYCPTKREILRTLMRIFDPLGLIAQYLIRGRIILQHIWLEGTDWDTPVPPQINAKWKEFISQLQNIESIKISRLYSIADPSDCRVILVIFVDASEEAFAAIGFLVFIHDSKHYIAQVMAKSKVAPTKRLTMPQLELQAALLGARLAITIKKLHPFVIHETCYLSDSKVTLQWIASEKYDFKIYVASRVGEILDSSVKNEWFYIGTKQNVADDATRWSDSVIGDSTTRWFKGADFMLQPRENWPIQPATEIAAKSQVSQLVLMIHEPVISSPPEPDAIDRIGPHFSKQWNQLVRVVAFLRRFNKKKRSSRTHFVTPEEFCKAEDAIFRKIQREAFHAEFAQLESGHPVSRGKLVKFCPFVEDGLIRMSSRAQLASSTYAARAPIILPNRHPLVAKFIEQFHLTNHHRGEEMTIADVRSRAWIVDTRSAVRRVKRNCQICKNQTTRPTMPRMGLLPPARLDFTSKPFTNVGMDVFGPYKVKFGRGSVKRYGIIFTCLTFRAVHLEMLEDLSTESCIMAIKSFLSRRGWSREFYSDNGTNFVGSNNLLTAGFASIEKELSRKVANTLKIKWNFIPAYSPWFGGAWERLIQSIKHCIDFVMRDEIPHESAFKNALTEAELWMNRRPLTHIPIDHQDDAPLTPNTALFGNNQDELASTSQMFNEATESVSKKKAANRVQFLVDKFLSRWTREYLPSIIVREKWHETPRRVTIGDVAVLVDPRQPKNAWSLCKVIAVHPGKDNHIRAVDVQLPDKSIKLNRSVGRIAVLDVKQVDAGSMSTTGEAAINQKN